MDKASLRQALRTRRQALATGDLAESADRATRLLFADKSWREAHTVALHLAVRGELPTSAVLAAAWAEGKRVALPRMSAGRMELRLATRSTLLVRGTQNIPEPPADAAEINPTELDLVLTPGAAFDRSGGRLGQGGGDYDRLLAKVRPDCATIGWCHTFQLVDTVPTEPHDRRVTRIITPDGAYLAAR